MKQEVDRAPAAHCIQCGKLACQGAAAVNIKDNAPESCPSRTMPSVLEEGLRKSLVPEMKEFARQAALQQRSAYCEVNGELVAVQCRVEETIEFAAKMGYKRLGLAFCSGLRKESAVFHRILEHHGFEVVSVCCKVGGISKQMLGVEPEHQIDGITNYEVMCNPITQAEALNNARTEFNIALGLCVGHDSLFLKHSNALCTVVAVKDRVLGHNPIAALHLSGSYCQRALAKAGPTKK